MKSATLPKDLNTKKTLSSSKKDRSIHNARNDAPVKQELFENVQNNAKLNKTTSSAETIAAELNNIDGVDNLNSTLLELQKTHGNQYVQKVLGIQAKLRISAPGDIYEQEADKIADEILQKPDSNRRNPILTKPIPNLIRKKSIPPFNQSTVLKSHIKPVKGSGQPLAESERNFFESRFGYDFTNVRIHNSGPADQFAQLIHAKAFTANNNIIFRQGNYLPSIKAGRWLLAHELTHVIQQKGNNDLIRRKEESGNEPKLTWGERARRWVFEKTLGSVGISKEQLMGFLSKAGNAIMIIIENPGRFVNTLIKALGQGFRQFKDNIMKHLKLGLIEWLFGTMSEAGIEMPKDFSFKSILNLVLQVLGLTPSAIKQRLVSLLGSKKVSIIEKVWDVLSNLMSEGVGGLWEMLKEYMGNLKEMVIEEIKSWLITQIVIAAVTKVLSMFNPVSGIITIIKTLYNVIKFLVEQASKIMALFRAITDSIVDLAMGAIDKAANKVEETLARLVPLVIGLLANILGIGGIANKIKEIIKKIQDPIHKAIDKVLLKVVGRFTKLLPSGKAEISKVSDIKGKKYDKKLEKQKKQEYKLNLRKKVSRELPKEFNNPEQLNSSINATYNKYHPAGLKSLRVTPEPNESGTFQILAETSPEKPNKKTRFNPILKLSNLIRMRRHGTALIAKIHTNKIGPKFSRGDIHAEDKLLDNLKKNWTNYVTPLINRTTKAKKYVNVKIIVNITRSPCSRCAGRLIRFANSMKNNKINNFEGFNVIWDIRPTTFYYGASKKGKSTKKSELESFKALEKLRKRGHKLTSQNLLQILKEFGIDPKDLDDNLREWLEKRINDLKKKIESINKIKKGK